jgi:hypothetical protein
MSGEQITSTQRFTPGDGERIYQTGSVASRVHPGLGFDS